MTVPDPKIVKRIFDEAAEIAPARRAAYLVGACAGDVSLRAKVESLLSALDGAPEFLAMPTAGAEAEAANGAEIVRLREGPGATIGPYKLLQLIGEGGFGSVFMAEQQKPVQRRVALKIIKLGMDTRQVIARFEAERQALAMMDHPNIARVLDAGATDTGRPYFVMELVKGVPITEYCDTANLSTADRLALFVPVCNAVQHAHQKGIIHRDIKPSNVLITMHDGVPVPKVIDFGIAKATQGRLTEKTLFTEHKQMIGTPEYMSPEQAEMSGLDIDTRSDIYSLGVLLYELLTGSTPFSGQNLRSAAFGEIQRIIREVEPPRPSTRVSTLAATLASTAAHRKIEPKKLAALIRGDLDWIVMKALEKDRTRRYDTATAMAADVRRHLNGEAVTAAPPSRAYRIRKFVRRHRVGVTVSSVVLTVLIAGVLGTSWGFMAAARRAEGERLAKIEAVAAKGDADAKRTLAEQKTAEAERSRKEAVLEAYAANVIAADASLTVHEVRRARARLDACPADLRNWEWRWLDARSDSSVAALRGHGSAVVSAAFSRDGTRVVTASLDKTARVWEAASGREIALFRGHEAELDSAAFSPDASRVVTASFDHTARVWDAKTGQQLALLSGHEGRVVCAAFSADGTRVVTASYDHTARIWDAQTGRQLRLLSHAAELDSAAFSPDASRVVTVLHDNTAWVWDAVTGDQVAVFRRHEGDVYSAAFSPDGTRVVTTSHDKTARVWDAATGEELAILYGHEAAACRAAFSPDGARIVTASWDSTARVWDVATGRQLAVLWGHENQVNSAEFSRDGARVLTASQDSTARVWNAASGKELAVLCGHEGGVLSAAFSPDGERVVTASWDGTARLWDGSMDKERYILVGPGGWIRSAAFSPDGARFLIAGNDNTARVYDAETRTELGVLRGHGDHVHSTAFSPDGARVVTASRDRTARVWEAASGKEITRFRGHEGEVVCCAFSPEGTRVVTASLDKTARVWDAATGKELAAFRGHEAPVFSAAFSPDGTRVLTASDDRTARVWEVESGKELVCFRGHTGRVWSAAFNADATRVITASRDFTARMWDAVTAGELARFSGHERDVTWATFSPDGARVVTASWDQTARVWDAVSGKELAVLRGHVGIVRSAAFSPDGTRVVTASDDGTARIWDGVPYGARFPVISAMRQAAAEMDGPVSRRIAAGEDPDAVSRSIREDGALSPSRREAGLEAVHEEKERRYAAARASEAEARKLNTAAWSVVAAPGSTQTEIALALEKAVRAAALAPDAAHIINTLGVAQYRATQYEEALRTLSRSRVLYSAQGLKQPSDLAFTAMAHFRLGHAVQANTALASLRPLMTQTANKDSAESQGFLREAESLIDPAGGLTK